MIMPDWGECYWSGTSGPPLEAGRGPETTKGEERVRMGFNPNQMEEVRELKQLVAEFIDLCEELRDKIPDQPHAGSDTDCQRWLSLAQTAAEEAAMWGVKAVTRYS